MLYNELRGYLRHWVYVSHFYRLRPRKLLHMINHRKVITIRGGSSRRAVALPEKSNAHDSPKLVFSLDLVTKFNNNHFRYFRHHFGSTFPRNPTKPMFHSFPTTPLMRWRFQHTCRWIWRFRGGLRHSPERKKPNNWLQETWWYIRLSQSVFVIMVSLNWSDCFLWINKDNWKLRVS